MKTLQEMLNTSDRMSTHEELHQVLALLDERTPVRTETQDEADEARALREAVADLWRDAASDGKVGDGKYEEEIEVRTDSYRWAELAGKTDRVN